MPYPQSIDSFVEKLNKADTVYVIEDEELVLEDGVFEGELAHDNVKNESVMVFTGPKMSGERIENFFLSIPSNAPWKRVIKVFSDAPKVYVTYETTGDQVEAEDINRVQESIVNTQTEVERYKAANDQAVEGINVRLTTAENNKAEKTYVDTELLKKADKVTTYTKTETDDRIQAIIGAAPEALDTLAEIADALNNDPDFAATITNELATKVDKVAGKGLSTEDYTTTEKTKLAGIEAGANKYIHPSTHPASMIVETSEKRFVSDIEKAAWNAKETPAGAQEKANIAEANAKSYTDIHDQNTTKHITATERTNWNDANAKKHTHSNKSILDIITQTLINAWNSAVDHISDGASHSKTARFVVGTSTAGWTLEDCDYLCDGTNDQEEIIQALNDLPATGGEVVILDGTYNIMACINIPKDNVSIRGNGNATILKRMYNSTDADSGPTAKGLITLNEKSGCKIQGLQIDGNKATYTASYNYGIFLASSNNNTVTNNTCNNNSYGIRLDSSSNENTVTGNTCNNNSYGIRLSSSSDNTVTGNTCNNNSSNGIYLSSSSNNTVTGNTCNNNYYGIFLNSSSNNAVTGNTCNNNNNGIRLYLSSSDNTVTGNTCNNNSSTGIYLYSSSSDNTVTGNTCIRGTGTPEDYTTSQYTIFLSGTSNNYNLISSNNCMGKAPVVEGGTGNTVFNNKWNESSDFEDLRADVVAHKADAVKHITSAERASWNAKETPAGAQAKADIAEQNAKAYADIVANTAETNVKNYADNKIDDLAGAGRTTETVKEVADDLVSHKANTANPHNVTKSQVGLANVDNVQQASKTEFTAHVNDTIKHVTSAERTAWNNKAEVSQIPTKVGQLENDKNYVTQDDLGSAGYGDMMKAIYDSNGNGKVDVAETVIGNEIQLGSYKLVYNSTTNSLDIEVVA